MGADDILGVFRCNNVLWISGAKGGKGEDSAMEG